jgi:CRISPR-associated protein Csm3
MSSSSQVPEIRLAGKLILDASLVCLTGLHIGAGKGSLEIGGADNPVVKDAFGRPIVPGSSLRGRLRSLLEHALGLTSPDEMVYLSRRRGQEVRIHQSDRADDPICLLFGRNPGRMERMKGDAVESRHITPARLAIYDAPLELESITAQMREQLDDELTEVKSENAIDRITAQANPRTLERVPAGARFRVRIVIDLLQEGDQKLVPLVVQGLRLMEDSALGGGGSRGSGRIEFQNIRAVWRSRRYYAEGAQEEEVAKAANTEALQQAVLADEFALRLSE